MSKLGTHKDEFVDRNLFLYGVLGLVAFSMRARAFIDSHLVEPSATVHGEGAKQTAHSHDDRRDLDSTGYLVLGTFSVIRSFWLLIDTWLREAPAMNAAARSESVPALDTHGGPAGLLR